MGRRRFSDEDDDRDDDRRRDDRDDDRRRRDDRDDDDRDDRRSRPRYEDDYDDRRPRGGRAKPGLAVAAGVLWVIWGAFEIIGVVLAAIHMTDVGASIRAQGGFGFNAVVLDPETLRSLTILGGFRLAMNVIACGLYLMAGIRTLTGGPSSLGGYGWGTVIVCVATVAYFLAAAFVMSNIFAKLGGPFAGGQMNSFLYGAMCGGGLLAISGALLAGIFALASNGKYMTWWESARGGRRGD